MSDYQGGNNVTTPIGPVTDLLSDQAQQRLTEMIEAIEQQPRAIDTLFPAAAREVGRGAIDEADPGGMLGPTLEDAVRGALLIALRRSETDSSQLLRRVSDLYRFGDSDERRAILRNLHELGLNADAAPLVEDALRTNDTRLIGAAMGTWAGRHLAISPWRHGVLKCLFTGVPLAAVDNLKVRADAELARMVADFCRERVAAGRDIPPDATRVFALFPDVLEQYPDVAAAGGSADV